jgi:hypothetical protein
VHLSASLGDGRCVATCGFTNEAHFLASQSKMRYRIPLVMMDVYAATKAGSAGYWLLPPGAATAVCLASCLAAEALSYYMWKRSDCAARTDFVSKRLGITMQARGRVPMRA